MSINSELREVRSFFEVEKRKNENLERELTKITEEKKSFQYQLDSVKLQLDRAREFDRINDELKRNNEELNR